MSLVGTTRGTRISVASIIYLFSSGVDVGFGDRDPVRLSGGIGYVSTNYVRAVSMWVSGVIE